MKRDILKCIQILEGYLNYPSVSIKRSHRIGLGKIIVIRFDETLPQEVLERIYSCNSDYPVFLYGNQELTSVSNYKVLDD